MILNPKEEGRFYNFFCFITDHKKSSYKFVFADGEIKSGKYFSNAESDNCLELDDPEYEEFWTVIFESIETGDLFEVTYHNMPVEVWCDGIKIDFGE
jgi:hypothetical protein